MSTETKPVTSSSSKPSGTISDTPKDTKKPDTKPAVIPKGIAKPVAKPTPPEPELPKFEKDLADKITNSLGDKAQIAFVKENRIRVDATKENVIEVAEFIRDELEFDHAESVTGVDYPQDNEIEIVYHLGSYTVPRLSKQVLTLATRVPREEDPRPGNDSSKLPSLRDVFYSVEFHERECFEMLGVFFTGHPDNRRLLLPEDWADLPPMRKDFKIKGR